MRRWQLTTLAAATIMVVILVTFGVGFLWLGDNQEIAESPGPGGLNPSLEADSPQQELTQESDLPEHPLESMGIAKLTESQGMPEDAITEEEAIDLVTELTWGPERDFYLDKHPASAIPATYNAEENSMGPAADNLPVWVVVLDGWGRSVPCGGGIGPRIYPEASGKSSGEEGSGSGDDCLTVETSSQSCLKSKVFLGSNRAMAISCLSKSLRKQLLFLG